MEKIQGRVYETILIEKQNSYLIRNELKIHTSDGVVDSVSIYHRTYHKKAIVYGVGFSPNGLIFFCIFFKIN